MNDEMKKLLEDINILNQPINNPTTNNQVQEKKNFILEDSQNLWGDKLSEEKIEEIINCNANSINVTFKTNDYNSIFSAIKKINNFKQNVTYKINITDKNSFNNFIFNNEDILTLDNIKIIQNERAYENVSFQEYVKKEKMLLDMVAPARNLSPLEQYLYAYNLTKNFKEYTPSTEGWEQSRALYNILDNEYIVCAGYTRLLEDLLDKLGIKSREFGVVAHDKETNQYGNHSILQVKIVDEKYGIDGIYFSDPTNDSDKKNDYYQYALMPNVEEQYIAQNSYDETASFFAANSVEEFYDNFKKWYNKQENKERAVKDLAKQFIKIIYKFDKNIYNEIFAKYSKLLNGDITETNIKEILLEVANYIENNLNNNISEEIKINTIDVLYRNFYGFKNEEEVNMALMQTIKINDFSTPHRVK